MRFPAIPAIEFQRNREKLTRLLPPNALVVMVSGDEMPRNGDQFFPYRPDSDFFYLTGISQPGCALILFPDHPLSHLREVFFAEEPDPVKEVWYGHRLTKSEIVQSSGIRSVNWMSDFNSFLRDCVIRADSIWLAFNEYPKFSTDLIVASHRLAQSLKMQYPATRLERLVPLLHSCRMVKEDWEVDMIRTAGRITGDAFSRVLGFVQPGCLEFQIEAEITHEFIRSGCTGHAYSPIVASGRNACILHYTENDKVCNDGDLVLLDFGAEYAYYAADLTRTIPVSGRFSKRQREVYESVLRIYKALIPLFTPDQSIDQMQKYTVDLMNIELVRLGLYSVSDLAAQDPSRPLYQKYYLHGVSHFMGMDVHDCGSRQEKWKEGMVLSCEPGIYLPDEGIGVRIETDILVGAVPQNLMPLVPVEWEEIEDWMNRVG